MGNDGWLDVVSIVALAVSLLGALLAFFSVYRSSRTERDQQRHIMELSEREALLRYAVEHLDELSDEDIERLGIHRVHPQR